MPLSCSRYFIRACLRTSIPVVPLQGQDRLDDIENISGIDIAQRVCRARESFLLSAAYATAHVDVAAPQFAGGIVKATRPMSWVSRSTELSPGTVTATLNFRGR